VLFFVVVNIKTIAFYIQFLNIPVAITVTALQLQMPSLPLLLPWTLHCCAALLLSPLLLPGHSRWLVVFVQKC